MLKNSMKMALTVLGMALVPFAVQAEDQTRHVSGEKISPGEIPGAYDQNAAYVCTTPWNVDLTASYLYWKWQQDSFQMGTLVEQTSGIANGFTGAEAVFQNPGYKTGAQIGIGIGLNGMDNWNLYSEYTWYRGSGNVFTTGTSSNGLVLPVDAFLAVQEDAYQDPLAGTLTAQLRMNFNTMDFLAQRSFYFGKKLTANFAAGLKALWITQHATNTLSSNTIDLTTSESFVRSSHELQTSWGLGPKVGFDSNWLLGYGMKILANISTSVLYTRYITNVSTTTTIDTSTISGTQIGLDNYGTLRPITETFLGFGWGSYFCNNDFHMDLAIGYDFNVYWNYNMAFAAASQTIGSMYLHGMNIRARLDF